MKYSFTLLFIVVFYSFIHAQPVSHKIQLHDIGLVSPDVASLCKFGNTPVNYSTGVPGISIPLYEVKAGRISVPISLDYHASGILVDEISSNVGIGWALSCGGVVARSMKCLPDEFGYMVAPDMERTITFENAKEYLTDPVDLDPDIFSYSFNGQNGKFYLNQDGTFFQVPVTDNVIQRIDPNSLGIHGFKITNPEGIQFVFTDIERITMNPQGKSFNNAWKLSKIIDLNTNEEVNFVYENSCESGISLETYRDDTWGITYIPDTDGPLTIKQYTGIKINKTTISHDIQISLKEINWRGGKVVLSNECNRLDYAGGSKLINLKVYNTQNSLMKNVDLKQSYFFNDSELDPFYIKKSEYNYRLKLDEVHFLSVDNSAPPQVYKMQYNLTQIASRYSCAQDEWGNNNGKYYSGLNANGYETMFPPTTITYNESINNASPAGLITESFGHGNRSIDKEQKLAGSLQSIQYPTGGKTVFNLETNKYMYEGLSVPENKTTSCIALNTGDVQTTNFNFGATASNGKYNLTFSSHAYTQGVNAPSITIRDITSQQDILIVSAPSLSSYTSGPTAISLTPGHDYSLTCNIGENVANNSTTGIFATISMSWELAPYQIQEVRPTGGLRVKSIINYDANGQFVSAKAYKYGINENEAGIIVTPAVALSQKTTYMLYVREEKVPGQMCGDNRHTGPPSPTYHSASLLPYSQISGSPVLYQEVAEYDVDHVITQYDNINNDLSNLNLTNYGKSVFKYDVWQDEYYLTYASKFGQAGELISNMWKNSFLKAKNIYKPTGSGQFKLISEEGYGYTSSRRRKEKLILTVQNEFDIIACVNLIPSMPVFGQYKIISHSIEPSTVFSRTYDDNGNVLTTQETYQYNNPGNSLMTGKYVQNSKGETITESYKYPLDFVSTGNVYDKMKTKNIISPLIEYKRENGNTQLILSKVNYVDLLENSTYNPTNATYLQPQTIDEKIGTYPVDTRVMFNKYDGYGNLLEQQKTDDVILSYIWGYNAVYPIAKVTGASSNDIAYTSFEDGCYNWNQGNWTFSGTGCVPNQSITGKLAYYVCGSLYISKTNLNSSIPYIISYWSKNGAFPINGSTTGVKSGKTINGWTYYEQQVSSVTSVTINGCGYIDELKLYPAKAQMDTYTFDPLVGMTSQCDINNNIMYYEYDGFKRLMLIKDSEGNILKTYEYKYQQ